jgi:hypothetical protein
MRILLLSTLFLAWAEPLEFPRHLLLYVQMREHQIHHASDNVLYQVKEVPLAADADTWLIYVTGPGSCSRGDCTLFVLRSLSDDQAETFGTITLAAPYVRVLDTSTNGMRDLAVAAPSYEGPPHEVILRFNGATYPENPLTEPAVHPSSETTIFSGYTGQSLFLAPPSPLRISPSILLTPQPNPAPFSQSPAACSQPASPARPPSGSPLPPSPATP